MINGAVFLFILGVWVSYKLACWAHDAAEVRAANQDSLAADFENRRQS